MNPSFQPGQAPNNNPNRPSQSGSPFLQPQYQNQGFLSPQGSSFGSSRGVYASTIQTSTSSSNLSKGGFGLGKLQSMGRTIKQEPDPVSHQHHEAPSTSFNQTSSNLSFKPSNDKGKLASSVIFQKNYDEDLNRFPGFNLGQPSNTQTGTSKLEALYAKKNVVQEPSKEFINQTPEDKRKRQIMAIKQQLEVLNKRMENTVTKKGEGQAKPYFQLPTRKTSVLTNVPPMTNNNEHNKTNFASQPQHDASKSFFASYAKGDSPQTSSVNSYAPQINDANKNFFTNYAKGDSNSQMPQANKQAFSYVPQAPKQTYKAPTSTPTLNSILDIKPQQQQAPTNFAPKTEAGGMFKKKNPYFNEDVNKVQETAPKTFLLSPKAATLTQGFKAPEVVKPVQIIPEVSQPIVIKGLHRTNSNENIAHTTQSTPFKKSDFAIGKKMGKGQFGQVMLVQHKITGFLCGMKVMSKKQIRQQKYVNQIARQLSIQFYLNHRNVAPLYGYFEDEQNVYLLIEYCTGGQLLQMLRKSHRLQETQTSPIIREICEGLDYIHKQEIIHRDIKPENILFNFNTVKICDFGWAVHSGSGMRKTVSGSPLYYSPEIVQQTEYDQKVDIWAIGMMTYQCLLGKIPFRIYSELDLNRIVEDEVKFPEYIDVTEQAKSFILGIMQKNPDDRFTMKDIFKHVFIRKYLGDKRLAPEIIQEFQKVLS